MNKKAEFRLHLFRKLWDYIIKLREFDDYWGSIKYPDFDPADFYSEALPTLISSLKEGFPFYDRYKEVIGFFANEEKQLIIDFMTWYKTMENISGHELFNDIMNGKGVATGPVDKLAKYVEGIELPENVLSKSVTSNDKIEHVFNIIERFTSATNSITSRRNGKVNYEIKDEYDMQDIFYTMLKPHFPTIKIEDVVSGKDKERFLKIDFVISDIKVAIECKCIRNKGHTKTLTKELNDDIQTYHKHQDCSNLIFFIYDKYLLIEDPNTLEENFSTNQVFDGKKMDIYLKIRPKN